MDSCTDSSCVELFDYASDAVERIKWDWAEWQKELPVAARHLGELYERYAEWRRPGWGERLSAEREWPRLLDAMRYHRAMDLIGSRD